MFVAAATLGLDPGIGIWHSDAANRDSLAFDVFDAVRPQIDRHAMELFRSRTFRKGEFHETREGVCRIVPPLTHELARPYP
jgi:CRISPR/Cas system-associated endonuclease Cas1